MSGEVPPCTARCADLVERARRTPGFMPDDEGMALHRLAHLASHRIESATMVEIGAWCGKSTIYLGSGAGDAVLFSVDHHHGSEENQPGWEHHDPTLVDPRTGLIDTLPWWRRAVDDAGLAQQVVGVVGDSPTIAAHWRTPLALCFIDGGHGEEPAWADFRGWSPLVVLGGWLAIHDVFPDPAAGGRPPYELWQAALASGEWEAHGAWGSLRALVRVAPPPVSRARGDRVNCRP